MHLLLLLPASKAAVAYSFSQGRPNAFSSHYILTRFHL